MMEHDLTIVRQRIYETYRTGSGRSNFSDIKSRAPYLRRIIRRYVPSDRTIHILDLGCGSGTLLYFLQQEGYRNIEGVDVSVEQVRAAAQFGIQGVRQGDLFATLHERADASIDVIFAFDVIEHLTKPELLHFGDEIFRVLRPGGRWIIHAPNADSLFGAGIRYRDWTHEQAFTRNSLNQIATALGFGRIQCYEDRPVPHGVRSQVRAIGWYVLRNIVRLYLAVETGSFNNISIVSQNLVAVATKGR